MHFSLDDVLAPWGVSTQGAVRRTAASRAHVRERLALTFMLRVYDCDRNVGNAWSRSDLLFGLLLLLDHHFGGFGGKEREDALGAPALRSQGLHLGWKRFQNHSSRVLFVPQTCRSSFSSVAKTSVACKSLLKGHFPTFPTSIRFAHFCTPAHLFVRFWVVFQGFFFHFGFQLLHRSRLFSSWDSNFCTAPSSIFAESCTGLEEFHIKFLQHKCCLLLKSQ